MIFGNFYFLKVICDPLYFLKRGLLGTFKYVYNKCSKNTTKQSIARSILGMTCWTCALVLYFLVFPLLIRLQVHFFNIASWFAWRNNQNVPKSSWKSFCITLKSSEVRMNECQFPIHDLCIPLVTYNQFLRCQIHLWKLRNLGN